MRTTSLLVVGLALVSLTACSGESADGAAAADEQDVNKASTTHVSALVCTVGKGVDQHDDAAKFSFSVKGFGTPKAVFVKDAWKVRDKADHVLESDGERSSVVAEGFENGTDVKQCRADAKKGVVCGSFVLSLDNSGSEMPVSITLTKKSNYRKGTLTIDNTINTGDNSGFLHAPVDCTVDGT